MRYALPPRARPQIGRIKKKSCSPGDIIRTSDQTQILRYRDGDTDDIIETIEWMDRNSRKWINRQAAADCLRGRTPDETLLNVWTFVKRNTKYRPDRPGHERVQSPGALFTSGVGDCKSYSIAVAALLRALDVPYKYRFTSYDSGDYAHVYVMARTPRGWVPVDAVYDLALQEKPFRKKLDMAPQTAINGVALRTIDDAAPPSVSWFSLALIGAIAYATL